MRKVNAIIERGSDGTYGIYIDLNENKLSYAILGDGTTVDDAKADFYNSYEEMKQLYKDENKQFEEVEFVFEYDVVSFLESYSKIFSKPALEKITGINQKQFFHYQSGKKPRKETVLKIQKGLQQLGKELSQVHFID
ncbi:MAG: DNA-binding protein [Prevotella sp.]|jgi:hypothetical protein|nr:DNA-binding protein [Prevotella sp.]